MNFDYVISSRQRIKPEDSLYAKIASRAIELMRGAVAGSITLDELDNGMLEVNRQMIEAEKDEAMTVIDENYPIWLAELLTKHFRGWHLWRVLCRFEQQNPENFKSRKHRAEFKQLRDAGFEKQFIEACRQCLSKIDAETENKYIELTD